MLSEFCDMQNKSYIEIFHADIRHDDISSLRHEAFRLSSRERSPGVWVFIYDQPTDVP